MSHRVPVAALLVGLALWVPAGCGSDEGAPSSDPVATDSASSTATGTATGLPACADVWVADALLPDKYTACDQDGEVVKPGHVPCASGQKILTQDDSFYVVVGYRIQEVESLKTDRDFKRTRRVCTG
jgi:hypothetical protein